MSFSFSQQNASPLQLLSRSLGQGIGGGLQAQNALNQESKKMTLTQKLEESRQIREEQREQARTQQGVTALQKQLKELGPEASIMDKYAAIAASPVSESSKKSLIQSLQYEGAKNFIQKIRENQDEMSVADILEGEALGYIPSGSGLELIRGIGGTKEREGAAKIYTPAFQETNKAGKSAREGIAAVRRQKEILENKKMWGPLNLDNLLSKFGIPGAASPEGQEFQAATLGYLTGEKSRFGVRLTDADLKLIQNKLPDIGRTKEGNEAILNLKESEYKFKTLESQAQQNVLKRNKGFTYDFQDQVDQELEGLLSQQPEIERLYTQSAETLKRLAGEEKEESTDFSHEQLPSASQHKGEYFEDEKGNIFFSNGKSWKKH